MATIFGHSWEAIKRAQQGGSLHERIDVTKPGAQLPIEADLALLAEQGSIEALEAAGFWGSAARLRRAIR